MNITVQSRLRLQPLVVVLLLLMGAAVVITGVRYLNGIGAISNLSNSYPWGFWVSFDLFTGIAISSGSFVIASMVYLFELEEFRPLLRPTLLTGLLGYMMEGIALMVELGHPERIWYFFRYQNSTSFLLFIGLYVVAYIAVLALEFSPTVFERLNWQKPKQLVKQWMKPVVILGAVISTLHQASLGSLLLIQPAKLHPLWWTSWIPPLFFVSSIAIGLAMTIVESSLSARYFKFGLETHLLQKLARALPFVLGTYLGIRGLQLVLEGKIHYLFASGILSLSFWAEIMLGVILPILWFSFKRLRSNPSALLAGSVMVLFGMILNRFNVSWLAVQHSDPLTYIPSFMNQVTYFPSLPEVLVSLGIFSFGILAFGLAVRYLPVFEHEVLMEPSSGSD
jgi:Ni/Fe-hydrogenase subunit HybB-like protein